MRDDLDTLLADVGREPTIAPDLDGIRVRGRRRKVARRAGAVAGTLALAGVLAVGANSLLVERPALQPIDAVPGGSTPGGGATEPASTAGTGGEEPTLRDIADLGATVVRVERSHDGAGGLGLTIADPEGGVRTARIAPGALPLADSDLVVDRSLRVFFTDADGNLLSDHPDDEMTRIEAESTPTVSWRVVGRSSDGHPLVTRDPGADVAPDAAVAPEVLEWTGDGEPLPVPGLDVAQRAAEGSRVVSVAAAPERMAVVLERPGGERQLLVMDAGAPDDDFSLSFGGDRARVPVDVALVRGEVWFLQQDPDGRTDLVVLSTDGTPPAMIETPLGREVDGVATDLDVAEWTDVPVVVLSARTDAGDDASGWLVDPGVVNKGLRDGETVALPGAFAQQDTPGRLALVPHVDPPAPAGACATDGSLLAPRDVEVAVWFTCDGADVGEDAYWPYARAERFQAANLAQGASGLAAVLRAWVDGPTLEEQARGLSGGLDPETATIGDVTVDVTTVTVDVLPGPEVGILSTSAGGAIFTASVVGAVLQFDAWDTVVLTLDGSCEAWAALLEGDGCPTYDETNAPWTRSAP